jgi:hypothetical protein
MCDTYWTASFTAGYLSRFAQSSQEDRDRRYILIVTLLRLRRLYELRRQHPGTCAFDETVLHDNLHGRLGREIGGAL